MQSPPTLPRRRGRVQPDPICCGLAIDGLTPESSAEYERPVICPAGGGTFRGRKQPLTGARGVHILRVVEILGGVKPGRLNERQKNDGCGRLVAGIGYLRLQERQCNGSPDVSS